MNQILSSGQHHLIDSLSLDQKQIFRLLDAAELHLKQNQQVNKQQSILSGKTVINLFCEPSTRTLVSFEIAARRLGAQVINVNLAASSVLKGENLIDMALTLDATQPDFLIIRHAESGAVKAISKRVRASVINAGDGAHEHPSQALLDAFVLRKKLGCLAGKKIAICGDILHSRVARSNINILTTLGAKINLIGPNTLLPKQLNRSGISLYSNFTEGIKDIDAIIMLRLQKERMSGSFIPSTGEYFKFFGLCSDKLALAKANCVVMHPGPINRGVEISSELVDNESLHVIYQQVEAGVAVRQAIFEILNQQNII